MSKPSRKRERRGTRAEAWPTSPAPAKDTSNAARNGARRRAAALPIVTVFLIKLAKHMALLACLIITGSATGRTTISQLGIFLLIIAAVALFALGRSLERGPESARLPLRGP